MLLFDCSHVSYYLCYLLGWWILLIYEFSCSYLFSLRWHISWVVIVYNSKGLCSTFALVVFLKPLPMYGWVIVIVADDGDGVSAGGGDDRGNEYIGDDDDDDDGDSNKQKINKSKLFINFEKLLLIYTYTCI